MPRNLSGTYSQPAGTAAVSGDVISSTSFNSLISDIGDEITNSLPRDGTAAMTADLDLGNNDILNGGAASFTSLSVTGTFNITDGTQTITDDNATNSGLSTILTISHTTSGVPAAGIGTRMDFVTETAAGNNEIGARIASITTDVTAASEDFDLAFYTMAAGATADEKMRLVSTGHMGLGTSSPTSRLHIAGSFSQDAWGTTPVGFRMAAATYTDSSTGNGGSLGDLYVNGFGAPTIAASGTGITYADVYNLNVAEPAAGTNVTITRKWAARFGGAVEIDVNTAVDGLRITQVGSGNAFVVEDNTSPDSTPLVIDTNGRFINGHTSVIQLPSSSSGTLQNPQTEIVGDSQALTQIGTIFYGSTAATAGSFTMARSNNATFGSHTILNNGDRIGSIQWVASDNTKFVRAATIYAEVSGTPGTDDMPTKLIFAVSADGSAAPADAMWITPAGNVGLTNPLTIPYGGTGGADAATARSNLGLAIGTNVQAWDADLDAIAALGNGIPARTAANTWSARTITGTANEIDVTNGNGVSGNPTLSLPTAMTLTGKTLTGGAVNPTSVNCSGNLLTSGGLLGYAAGVGGTVTQLTSKSTGVTLDKTCGTITMNNAALAAGASVTFTLTNNNITATDYIMCQHESAGTAGAYDISRVNPGSGTVDITVTNRSGGSLSEAIVLKFLVLNAVTS